MRERYTIKRVIESDEWAVITFLGGKITADERFPSREGQAAVDHLTALFAAQTARDMRSVHRNQAQAAFDEENKLTEEAAVKAWWRRLAVADQEALFDAATAYLGDGMTIPDCYHLFKTGKIRLEAVAV